MKLFRCNPFVIGHIFISNSNLITHFFLINCNRLQLHLFCNYSFVQRLTHNIFTCHTISETWLSNSGNTLNLQNHTIILCLFQFHKTLLAKHNAQFSMQHTQSNRDEYYGKGDGKYLLLRRFWHLTKYHVCDILNAVLHFARDVRHFAFCVHFLHLCVKLG